MSTTSPATSPGSNVKVHSIEVPQNTPFNPHAAKALIEHLASSYNGNLTFRLSTESGKVAFEIIDYQATGERSDIAAPIRSVYGPSPWVETRPLTPLPYTDRTRYHLLAPLLHPSTYQGNWFLSSVHLTDAPEDPLTYVAHLMGESARSGTVTYLSFILSSAKFGTPQARDEARRKILGLPTDTQKLVGGLLDFTVVLAGGHPPRRSGQPPAPDQVQRQLLTKADAGLLCQLYLVLEVYGDNERRVFDTANNVVGHLLNQYRGELAGIGIPVEPVIGEIKVREIRSQAQLDKYSLPTYMKFLNEHPEARAKTCAILTGDELAALWHLPHEGMAAEYVTFSTGNRPAPALLVKPTDGIQIGVSRGQPVYLWDEDRWQHINIVGKTGTGKSSLMENMIRQDIERGKGVGVIDPHGQLIRNILAAAIPDSRVNDVVLVDITDPGCPPPLNPLSIRDEDGKIPAGLFYDIVSRLDENFRNADRAQTFLTGALSTLNYAGDVVTIRDIVRLFQDEEYRQSVVKPEDKLDDATYTFWSDEFYPLTDAQKRDYPFPVIHRMRNFYSSDFLSPMLCHPKPLDWGQLMAGNKIILVALDAANTNVSERDKQLLGTLAMTFFETSAFRVGKPQPLDFYLYVDEVQQFINTSLDNMFSGIRKFGVHLTVSNQRLGQLSGKLLEDIMGNVGATVIFEMGLPSEAHELAHYTEPGVTQEKLLKLGRYRAAVRMQLHGIPQPVFTMETEVPWEATSAQAGAERIAYLRDLSRRNNQFMCQPDITNWLKQRYPRRPLGGKPLTGHEAPDGSWGVPSN